MQDYIKHLSLKYGLDARVITEIVNHPLKFTRRVVTSSDDRSVRIRHLGIFSQKRGVNKYKLLKRHVDYMTDRDLEFHVLPDLLNMDTTQTSSYLYQLLEDKKYLEISELYYLYNKVIRKIYRDKKQNNERDGTPI